MARYQQVFGYAKYHSANLFKGVVKRQRGCGVFIDQGVNVNKNSGIFIFIALYSLIGILSILQ